jgi:hypothetical protein
MADQDAGGLIGRLAVHYKLITMEQLAAVTREQARLGGGRRLGDLLVEKGLLSQSQLERLLHVQKQVLAKQQAGITPPAAAAPAAAAAPTPESVAAMRAVAPAAPAVASAPAQRAAVASRGSSQEIDGLLREAEPRTCTCTRALRSSVARTGSSSRWVP